jgi:hypothetical protein
MQQGVEIRVRIIADTKVLSFVTPLHDNGGWIKRQTRESSKRWFPLRGLASSRFCNRQRRRRTCLPLSMNAYRTDRVWERTVVTGLLRNRRLCLGYRVLQKCVSYLRRLNSSRVCVCVCVRHPQHTQTGSNSSTIAADSSNGVTNTRCCRYSCMRSW